MKKLSGLTRPCLPAVRFALLLVALLLGSCARVERVPLVAAMDAPVWPPPPELARVQYVTSVERHSDLFRKGGFFHTVVRIAAGEEETRMVRPHGLAIHPEGGVLVTDPGLSLVHFYDTHLGRYRAIGRDLEGGLTSPVGVAVAADGSILVSDSRRRTIESFDRDGRHGGAFGSHIFQRPAGITVDPQTGEVFVVDVMAHHVVVMSPTGEVLRVLGANGALPGLLNFPSHLALESRGNLLVADSMNFRIQRLAPDGTPLSMYGEAGNARGDFARPKGVAHVGQDVYVAVEGLYDSLVFFNAAGDLLLNVGGAGSEPGQFWLPAGIAMDRERGLLFVADSYNGRVQVFRMINLGAAP